MTFTVYSSRQYGQPKLEKPIELRGVKPSFTEVYIHNKCSFPVFVLHDADQVWIKATDWFSPCFRPPDPKDLGKSQSEILAKYFPGQKTCSKEFTYHNNYASVVLRCEAWICFFGLFKDVEEYDHGCMFERTWPTPLWLLGRMTESVEQVLGLQPFDLTCSNLERFFERVISRVGFCQLHHRCE